MTPDVLTVLRITQSRIDDGVALRKRRDELVFRAYNEGFTIREIGMAIGRSHQAVAKIVRKSKKDKAAA